MRLMMIVLMNVGFSLVLHSQTLLFSEDFETTTVPDSVTYTGSGTYGTSSSLFSQGLRSDSMRIAGAGDSVMMTTQSFSTTGSPYVMLYFDHICKIEFFDEGYIEVSNNNGATWTRLTGTHYMGTSQFAGLGNKFTVASYPVDWAAGIYAAPANSWWQNEVFDISLLASNAANVRVRFVLRDAQPGNTMPDNYAWFIDHIRVIGTFTDAIPPVITVIPPVFADTLYSQGPFVINATITDASGIDTAMVVYTVNAGIPDTIGMVHVSGSLFTASIPIQPFNTAICYKIVAIDGYVLHNTGNEPTQGCIGFYTKYALAGTYTVGGTGADYASVTDALSAVTQAGVYGPVVFLISPGTYAGQYTFETIEGTSLVNTVTFRSATGNFNDVIWLTYPVTANFTVRFNSARCITLKQITIRTTNATGAKVVDFLGSSNHIIIDSCFIDAPISSNSSSVVVNSSITNPIFNITISNCTLKGGYYGVRFVGVSQIKMVSLNLVNNFIYDYFYYGVYMSYVDSLYIVGNRLQNAANSGLIYPMYIAYTTGSGVIGKNRIISTGSSANYGLYLAYNQSASTTPLLVSNNFISQSGNATGWVYLVYIKGSNYINFYNNSVHVTGGSATGGRCFHLASGSGINIVNNIFANSNGGYAYYVGAPAAVGTANYNAFHSTGSNFAYWTTNQTTLAGLQTVSGKELHSQKIQPAFTSNHDLHLTNVALSGLAQPLNEISDDIDGMPRSASPTIGAHEVPLLPGYHDVGIARILGPPLSNPDGKLCFYDVVTSFWCKYDLNVRIRNYGQYTQTVIPIAYTFIDGGLVHTETWNGSLAGGDSVDVTLQSKFLPRLGPQQVCVETALAGDPIVNNNKACKTFTGVICSGLNDLQVDGFVLGQNTPNPATQTTTIGYYVPQQGDVAFGVATLVGQLIHTETLATTAGHNQIEFDVSNLAAGVYYYFVEFNGQRLTKKMVVGR